MEQCSIVTALLVLYDIPLDGFIEMVTSMYYHITVGIALYCYLSEASGFSVTNSIGLVNNFIYGDMPDM